MDGLMAFLLGSFIRIVKEQAFVSNVMFQNFSNTCKVYYVWVIVHMRHWIMVKSKNSSWIIFKFSLNFNLKLRWRKILWAATEYTYIAGLLPLKASMFCQLHIVFDGLLSFINIDPNPRLTERVGAVGVGRRRRLFGVQCVGEARSLVWACEGIQGWFSGDGASGGAAGRVQTSRGGRGGGMRGKLLLLHQQRLVQLTLVLLDLLLHVGDCTCNLGGERSSGQTMCR